MIEYYIPMLPVGVPLSLLYISRYDHDCAQYFIYVQSPNDLLEFKKMYDL